MCLPLNLSFPPPFSVSLVSHIPVVSDERVVKNIAFIANVPYPYSSLSLRSLRLCVKPPLSLLWNPGLPRFARNDKHGWIPAHDSVASGMTEIEVFT